MFAGAISLSLATAMLPAPDVAPPAAPAAVAGTTPGSLASTAPPSAAPSAVPAIAAPVSPAPASGASPSAATGAPASASAQAAASALAPASASDDDLAPPPPRDPLQGFNRASYAISQPIDRYLFRPVAIAYVRVLPHPLRDGVHNVLANLFEPVIFVNDLLQLRFKRALHTAVRMGINTALGIAGIFDVAKRPYINLPDQPNGFADTLGYYGIGSGPYLYLPILGPTSVRDAVGGVGDLLAQPRLLGKLLHPDNDKSIFRSSLRMGDTSTVVMVVSGIDERARNDDSLEAIRNQSVDPYASLRSSYLQDRAGEIAALQARDGASARIPELDDPLRDPAAATPPRPAPSAPAAASPN